MHLLLKINGKVIIKCDLKELQGFSVYGIVRCFQVRNLNQASTVLALAATLIPLVLCTSCAIILIFIGVGICCY